MDTKKKRVYRFGGKSAEGDGSMRNLLGGKGANLAEMCLLGIPVPAGFTITTECCAEYYELCGGYTDALKEEVAEALKATEAIMGKKFGDRNDPLLVSCRSGARSSMPGMMDTILNIGLCSDTIPGMIKKIDFRTRRRRSVGLEPDGYGSASARGKIASGKMPADGPRIECDAGSRQSVRPDRGFVCPDLPLARRVAQTRGRVEAVPVDNVPFQIFRERNFLRGKRNKGERTCKHGKCA